MGASFLSLAVKVTDVCVPAAIGSEVELVLKVEVDGTKGASGGTRANIRALAGTRIAEEVFAVGSKCGRVLGEGRFEVVAVV